jgi:hypothetical protein
MRRQTAQSASKTVSASMVSSSVADKNSYTSGSRSERVFKRDDD